MSFKTTCIRTSVFGAAIFAGQPFVENINATVQTLYRDAVAKFGASAVGCKNVPPLVGCCHVALTCVVCFSLLAGQLLPGQGTAYGRQALTVSPSHPRQVFGCRMSPQQNNTTVPKGAETPGRTRSEALGAEGERRKNESPRCPTP